MFYIKRLYRFILKSFLPLFLMTFFICLFIVLMQFLWRYVDEMVGKGLEMSVLAELFLCRCDNGSYGFAVGYFVSVVDDFR